MGIDHTLIYQAQKLMTGANVHGLRLLIFCYETSDPNSERHTQFEQLLREFVAFQTRIKAAQMYAEQARKYSEDVCTRSDALNRRIKRGLR